MMNDDPFELVTTAANDTMIEMSVGKRVIQAAMAARKAYWMMTTPVELISPVPSNLCVPIMQQAYTCAWQEFTAAEEGR